jgi:hypothetical protein
MTNDYLKRPGAALPESEREFLKALAEGVDAAFDDPIFVNIGVFMGATMLCLRSGSEKARIIGIDIKDPGEETRHVLSDCEIIVGDSKEVKVEAPVHLVFVDGSHKFDDVLADARIWSSRVPVGGVLAFHDVNNYHECHILKHNIKDVGPAVDKWAADASGWERVGDEMSMRAYRRVK